MIHRGDGEFGTADRPTVHPEAVERLRAGDLVHEVEIDVEEIGLAVGTVHHVAFPDLLGERLRHDGGSSCMAVG